MVRIGPSFIAGQGLFATRPLTQGSRIIEYRGEKISKHESARRLARHNNYIFRLNYPTVRPFSPNLLKSLDRGFEKLASSPLEFIEYKGLIEMAEPRDYRYDIDGQTLDNMARYINQGAEN